MLTKELEDFFFSELKSNTKVLEWSLVSLKQLPHEEQFRSWIDEEYYGQMEFLPRTLEERLDPQKWFPEAKSVLIYLYEYPVKLKELNLNKINLSSYAHGGDYHFELNEFNKNLAEKLENQHGIKAKSFTDAQPVFERDLALIGGLGWIGKNTFLINQKRGTAFFISGLYLDKSIEIERAPTQDFCGKCTRCLDECPTDAFESPFVLNAEKCLSYLTIERKGPTPKEFWDQSEGYVFGCDICQQVCPWNHKHLSSEKETFYPDDFTEWFSLLKRGGGFKSRFKGTPLQRAGRPKMIRNLALEALRQKKADCLDDLVEIRKAEDGWLADFLNEIIVEFEVLKKES